MADPKNLRDDLLKSQGRAIVQAGRDAARRVYEDLTLSEDEKRVKEAERAHSAKLRRWKWIAIGVGALLVVITLFVLVMKLWVWMLGLVVLAAIVAALYFYGRGKLRTLRDPEPAALPGPRSEESAEVKAVHVEPSAEAPAVDQAARERAIDDELAALKAKTRK